LPINWKRSPRSLKRWKVARYGRRSRLPFLQRLKESLIEIKEKLDENIEIDLDRVRIEQVLRNLLNNAIKFTPKGSIEIVTHVNQEKDELQILVSDSGHGIPQDVLPNIFEKFVTKNLDSENQSGTGLGLFLCKGIIECV